MLPGCGGGSNVVSDSTNGILSIEHISTPATTSDQGTVSIKLIAPAPSGGPGTGAVTITSGNTNLVTFSPSSQSVNANGDATFYFTVKEVENDTIVPFTVTVGSLSLTNQITIPGKVVPPVNTLQVNSIAFVSASPNSISLKGTGGTGRSETSTITFIVRDATGQPLAGQTVDFTLDTSAGGITLVPDSATSDSAGIVKTIVNSGVVSTPVSVTATVKNKTLSSKSNQLVISTGLPHQDGLSVSATTLNPETWNYDGVEVPITVMLSDHFGNPVPDGTAVYFMVHGGSIEANAITSNGKASVKWRSQAPRPANGKAKILAYAIGEESFTDLNGNGLADPGEFSDIPEAFLSKSGKLTIDPAVDPFIDFNGDGLYNTGDKKFNGVLQGNSYLGAPRSLHIFKNFQIIMSGSQAAISPDRLSIAQNTSTTATITITDENGNSLPENTTISFSSTIGGCLSSAGLEVAPRAITINNTGYQTSFPTVLSNKCTAVGSGNLIVTVKSPKGIETAKTVLVTY
jgi:hypothetical protein